MKKILSLSFIAVMLVFTACVSVPIPSEPPLVHTKGIEDYQVQYHADLNAWTVVFNGYLDDDCKPIDLESQYNSFILRSFYLAYKNSLPGQRIAVFFRSIGKDGEKRYSVETIHENYKLLMSGKVSIPYFMDYGCKIIPIK